MHAEPLCERPVENPTKKSVKVSTITGSVVWLFVTDWLSGRYYALSRSRPMVASLPEETAEAMRILPGWENHHTRKESEAYS